MDSVDSFTTFDGRQLGYRTLGKGPVLLCHPGGPGFNSQQLSDLGGLDGHFALVILDPRGTGASDPPANRMSYGLDDYARDIEQLRRHLSLEALTLFGHSHGAFVAVRYAIRYPRCLSRLILHGPLARNAGIKLPPIERYFVDWEGVGKP